MAWLLTKVIETGREAAVIRNVEAVIVDTTVMEKAIGHPTDARLYEKARRRLVALALKAGLSLRWSCARLAPHMSGQVGRYAHARQIKPMRKALRRLKGYTGCVMRDMQRQLGDIAGAALRQRIEVEIALVERLLRQKPKGKGKLYARRSWGSTASLRARRGCVTSLGPRCRLRLRTRRASSLTCG